jgi:hypothetical protein
VSVVPVPWLMAKPVNPRVNMERVANFIFSVLESVSSNFDRQGRCVA